MDDDDFLSDAESANAESEDEFAMNSQQDNNSDSMNVDEVPNPADGDIDTAEMLKTFKHLQEAFSGFAKFVDKKGKSRRSGIQTRFEKSNRPVRRKSRGKSSGAANTTERASSRFNSRYFGEIVAKLDDRKKKIIQDHGFGILLEYDGCSAPRGFVQWIADQVDLNCCDIVVGGKVIPFSAEAVHLFLELPIGGDDIREKHNDSMKNKFLSEINETSLPLIKTFGEKLLGDSLSDDDVFRFFMVVALSTFLCANSSTLPSPQYLGALIDVSKVKEWDWSKFVFDWLFASISNYRKKNRSTIGGCRYFLVAYYLDFVNFGKRHELPPSLPRILCWKGSMIKIFASYDHVSGDKYGKRPMPVILLGVLWINIATSSIKSTKTICVSFSKSTIQDLAIGVPTHLLPKCSSTCMNVIEIMMLLTHLLRLRILVIECLLEHMIMLFMKVLVLSLLKLKPHCILLHMVLFLKLCWMRKWML